MADRTKDAPVAERQDVAQARARILNAAEQLFARDGFDATPTARVADLAEVPKGLLFYYFPTKLELLRTLLAERLPATPFEDVVGIARRGDVAGSLLRLHRKLGVGQHSSPVLRTIIFREAETHPEVGEHIRTLRQRLTEITETVLDGAAEGLEPRRRRQAAQTFVAVMLDEANSRRFDAPVPDVRGAATIIATALSADPIVPIRRPMASAIRPVGNKSRGYAEYPKDPHGAI
jgi:AcrR family transcriptional regulator